MRNLRVAMRLAVVAMIGVLAGCGDPQERLEDAVANGDADAAARALDRGAVLSSAAGGAALIEAAVAAGDAELVRVLLYPPLSTGDGLRVPPDWGDTDALYETAIGLDDDAIAIELVRKFSRDLDEPRDRWVAEPGGVTLLSEPSLDADPVLALDEAARVSVESISDLGPEIAFQSVRWVFAAVDADGARYEGYTLDGYLTDRDLEAIRASSINEDRQIDSPVGIRMREAPALDGGHIMTLPGGAVVFAIREDGDELAIDGRPGRWTLVESNRVQGWVYGGYLGAVVDPPPHQVWLSYRADYAVGTAPGEFGEVELRFTGGNAVSYERRENMYQGFRIFTHEGTFAYEGSRITVVLGEGEERVSAEVSRVVGPAAGFTLELEWFDDAAGPGPGLIAVEDLARIASGGFAHDESVAQFVPEDDASPVRLGYFRQTGR